MRRILLLAAACSCADTPAPTPTPPERTVVADALAGGTALIVVNLRPDGSLDIDDISPRPIPYRQRGPRFDEQRHSAQPQTAPSASATVTPGSAPSGSVNDTGPGSPGLVPPVATPPTATAGPCVIVVRHGSAVPVVVSLDLGHPGEGGGDVADRWQNGSVILRAPYFGPGTRYTVLRMARGGSVVLAEKEVTP